jgi:hypothetical protein
MKMNKLYPDIIKDVTDILTGKNNISMDNCTMKIVTTGGQQIFESKFSEQVFEMDFSTIGHKGPCFLLVVDICSQIIDVRKIFLE